jgi:hypothetical protein
VRYALVQTVPPVEEPITLAEAKNFARVDITDDDALITSLISSGRQRCERVTDRQLITATWKLSLDRFPGSQPFWSSAGGRDMSDWAGWGGIAGGEGPIRLPKSPMQSVSLVQYVDQGGTTQTLAATEYQVDVNSEPALMLPAFGKVWPVTRWQAAAVIVTFVAGYGPAAAVPPEIKDTIKVYVAYRYDSRCQPDDDYLDRIFKGFWSGDYG